MYNSNQGPFYILAFDEHLNLSQANPLARLRHGITKEDILSRRHFDEFADSFPEPEETRQALLDGMEGVVSHKHTNTHGSCWFGQYGPIDVYKGAYLMAVDFDRLTDLIRDLAVAEKQLETIC